MGERYKMVPKEIKEYVKGMYGRPAVPIKREIVEKIIGDQEVITCRPADLLPPLLAIESEKIKEYIEEEEDVLSYILFPNVAEEYFKFRRAQKYKIDSDLVNIDEKTHPV